MTRHAAIRSGLFAILVLFAGQRLVDELTAKEASSEPLRVQPAIPGSADLTFFAMPQWAAPADHLAIPVLGIDPGSLHDDFLGSRGDRMHHAIDIMAPRGTPVVAAVDGTVLRISEGRAGGKSIYLADRAGTTIFYYAHLDRYAAISEKRPVRKGEILGFVGTSGNAPPNTPHLHFSVDRLATPYLIRSGTPINPYPILAQRGVTYRLTGGELTSSSMLAPAR